MSKRDEVRQQALVIATEIIDPEWHYDGFPAMARVLVDQILALEGIAVVDRKAETSFLPDEVQVKLGIDDLMPTELGIAFRRGYEQKHIDMLQAGWVKEVKR
mgnify:CR=1 FL=1